jgi:UDP-glucose:(heptosyl)LPS alpha-1,3-glucosyltransferase
MKPLRIAFLKNTFHASGGLEKYCLKLYEALCQRGHRVAILTASCSPDAPCTKICSRLRLSALNVLWFDFHCRQYLKSHPHDVVFGFDRHLLPLTLYRAGNGCHAAYLARRAKESSLLKRVSFSINPLHRITLLSEKYTFERHPPLFIICNSHLVAHEIYQYYPRTPHSRVVVIHNGVEWTGFAPHFQQKLNSPHDPNGPRKLLFIGHEWERKGLDRLLYALGSIREVSFHLTAVGRERNPDRFATLARNLHLEDKVTFIPTAQSALPYYKEADIAVIPSRYDPFANVTVEALAMGLFVVTTAANGGSEIITQNVNGIVLSEDAAAAKMGQAIASACRMTRDPALPEAIRESVKKFDFSHQLEGYLSLIESV